MNTQTYQDNVVTLRDMEASAYQKWMVRLQTQQGIWQTNLSFLDWRRNNKQKRELNCEYSITFFFFNLYLTRI